MTLSDLKIKRMVDWEWIGPVAGALGTSKLVMRCYETEEGRLYRVDTLELFIPNGQEYRFLAEVIPAGVRGPMTLKSGGGN